MAIAWTRWRGLARSLAAFLFAAAMQGLLHVLPPAGARAVPSLAAAPWAVAAIGVAALVPSSLVAVRGTEGGLAKLGAVTLHVVFGLACIAGVFASDPAFPFGPSYEQSLDLPAGHGRAYLYRGDMFCAQSVWRPLAGTRWWLARDRDAGSFTCAQTGILKWDPDAQVVVVVGPSGARLPPPEGWGDLGEGLDWRPH
jgi:hypothetical protein